MNTKKGNVTKVEVFQELIRKVLHKEVELEEVQGVDVHGEGRESKSQAESEGSVDK